MAEWNLWLLILGIAAGAAVTWLVIGTIARNDDEVAAAERAAEATWISGTIQERGGRAPVRLVEQILALHRRYLRGGSVLPVAQSDEEDAESGESEGAELDGPRKPRRAAEPEMKGSRGRKVAAEPEMASERDVASESAATAEASTPAPGRPARRAAGTRKPTAGRTARR